jgi:hypothetical protein
MQKKLNYIGWEIWKLSQTKEKNHITYRPHQLQTYYYRIRRSYKRRKEITIQVFKRVEIKSFVSDLDFVVETLPVKLSWEIDNSFECYIIIKYAG